MAVSVLCATLSPHRKKLFGVGGGLEELAGRVSRCDGVGGWVSTKAHLFGVCWTKQPGARWIEGPWGWEGDKRGLPTHLSLGC